jgi:zinc transport system substrate-binding protein
MPNNPNATLTRPAVLMLVVLTGIVGCGSKNAQDTQHKPQLFVSVAPLAFFAKRIAREHLTVNILIDQGANPHTYTPTPRQIVSMARGGLLFSSGASFERTITSRMTWDKTKLKIVDLAAYLHGNEPHAGHEGHDHADDNHIWMSPRSAKLISKVICGELCAFDPPHAEEYRSNLTKLQADLDALDARLTTTLKPLSGKNFFIFHPSLGYFARDYGLVQHAVEHEGKSPGPRHRSKLVALARASGVKTIFVEPQFSQRAANVIAEEIGGKTVMLDPLSEDYINNMEQIAEEFQKALKP